VPSLQRAMQRGITVISWDSGVAEEGRQMHLAPSSDALIGRMIIQLAADHLPDGGDVAILSATATSTNQNTWIAEMEKVIQRAEIPTVQRVMPTETRTYTLQYANVADVEPPAEPVPEGVDPPPEAVPTRRLVSEPPDAEVWVGGERIGRTPLDVELGPGGAVEVELRLEGYRRRRVTLSEGEEPETVVLRRRTGRVPAGSELAPR